MYFEDNVTCVNMKKLRMYVSKRYALKDLAKLNMHATITHFKGVRQRVCYRFQLFKCCTSNMSVRKDFLGQRMYLNSKDLFVSVFSVFGNRLAGLATLRTMPYKFRYL